MVFGAWPGTGLGVDGWSSHACLPEDELSHGLRGFQTTAAGKPVRGEEIEVNLRDPGVSVGLLHPPVVAERTTVSAMATASDALAGVNGDFFNITETHPGVQPTGSSVTT